MTLGRAGGRARVPRDGGAAGADRGELPAAAGAAARADAAAGAAGGGRRAGDAALLWRACALAGIDPGPRGRGGRWPGPGGARVRFFHPPARCGVRAASAQERRAAHGVLAAAQALDQAGDDRAVELVASAPRPRRASRAGPGFGGDWDCLPRCADEEVRCNRAHLKLAGELGGGVTRRAAGA